MKSVRKKCLAVALAFGMLFALTPAIAHAENACAAESGSWSVSKSKTATNLDANGRSEITLSLPSVQEELVSDVVFVLDKSTSVDVTEEALSMLASLKQQVEQSDAKVNVGIVIFNKVANVANDGQFFDLTTQYDAIAQAMKKEISGGTNMHAGLLAAKAILDGDSSVEDSRKYLVLVSDGLSYYFCQGADYATPYTISSRNGGDSGTGGKNEQPNDGLYTWEIKYGNQLPQDWTWTAWLNDVETVMKSDYAKYVYALDDPDKPSTSDLDSEGSIPYAQRAAYPINADISLYASYQLYQEMSQKYHTFALLAGTGNADFDFGVSFMNFLSNGETVDFADIQKEIYYLLDAGSKVEDYMGYVEGEYDFDFVNDASAMTLQVGKERYEAHVIAENTYGFKAIGETGKYAFVVEYVPGKGTEEHFVWYINEPVSNFAPVQLTYAVELTNPSDQAGTYGAYDADGSKGYPGLYTNHTAILYPVDSRGESGKAETFARPTVSYTVEETLRPSEPQEPTPPSEEQEGQTPEGSKGETTPTTASKDQLVPWSILTVASAALIAALCLRRRLHRSIKS